MSPTLMRNPRAPTRVRPPLARNEYATAAEREREGQWWAKYAQIEEHFYWVLPADFQPRARQRYMQRAADFLHGAKHVIDYGCGNGWITRKLGELLRTKVTGLDFSATQIALARSTPAPQGVTIDFQIVDGPQSLPAADAYVFHGVLHHLPASEIHDLMEQVQRLAPSGARLVFVEPTCFPKLEPTEEQQALLDRINALIQEPAAALLRAGRHPGAHVQHVRDTADERWWGELPYGPSPLERPFLGDELSKVISHYFDLHDTAVVQYLPASQAVAGELTLLAEDAPDLAHAIAPDLLLRVDELEQTLIGLDSLPDTGWYMQLLTATVR